MRLARRLFLSFLAPFWLLSCDSSDRNGVPLALYEDDVGEAAIRHLIDTVPDPTPAAPKSWTVVLGEIGRSGVYEAASLEFLDRFIEGGRRVISADALSHTDPDNMIIDPELRVAVYVLQLRLVETRSAAVRDVEIAWSYKKHYQRLKYVVEQIDGEWKVTEETVTEGNWPPEEEAVETVVEEE